jgi:hypothetical protein
MDDQVKHKLRVGDVFLEPDGWGRVLTKVAMGSDIYVWQFLKSHTMCITSDYGTLESIKIKPTWIYMYNLCDIFGDTEKALKNEHTDT